MELPELDLSAAVWRGHGRSFKAATVTGRFFFPCLTLMTRRQPGGGGEPDCRRVHHTSQGLSGRVGSGMASFQDAGAILWRLVEEIIQEKVRGEDGSARFSR